MTPSIYFLIVFPSFPTLVTLVTLVLYTRRLGTLEDGHQEPQDLTDTRPEWPRT